MQSNFGNSVLAYPGYSLKRTKRRVEVEPGEECISYGVNSLEAKHNWLVTAYCDSQREGFF